MLGISDNSIKKVMECIECEEDARITLCYLRRSCFRTNKVAINNEFHKLKSASFSLISSLPQEALSTTEDTEVVQLYANIGRGKSDYYKTYQYFAENPVDSEHLQLEDYLRINKALSIFGPWTTDDIHRKYQVSPEMNINNLVEQALTDVLLKVRSIDALELWGLKLDSELLGSLKKCSTMIRSASTIHIQKCKIEWTEEDLLEFLKIFKNPEDFVITGKFSQPIVNDQLIALVSEKIYVCNDNYNPLHFPGITSKSCDHWVEKRTKHIDLDNISTRLSITNISELAQRLNDSQPKQLHTHIMHRKHCLNFGFLNYLEYRDIVLVQRNSNTTCLIVNTIEGIDQHQVTCNDSHYSYEFRVLRPYEKPDFAIMLEMINEMRAVIDVAIVDEETFNFNENRLITIHLKVVDYESRNELPPVTFENVDVDEVLARGFHLDGDGQIDQDAMMDFMRRGLLADINRLGQVIHLRMREIQEAAEVEESNEINI